MKRYMLFVHMPDAPAVGPCFGAVEVPACFEPTDEFVVTAAEAGLGISVVNEDELAAVGGLEGLLLRQGQHLMTVFKQLLSDPSFN